MKKLFALVLAVVLVVSAGPAGARAARANAPTAKVTLSLGYWDSGQTPAMQAIVNAFSKSSGIAVTLQQTPFSQYWTKLQTSASGGAVPDVVWMNGPHFYLYASFGILKSLDSLIKRDRINLSHYPNSLVNLYTYKGHHFALPKDFDTIGLWYNKSLFRAAHIGFPNSNWTWKTLQTAAKKLTNKKTGVYGIAAKYSNQEASYNLIFQAGGYVISKNHKKSGYDNPKTIKALQYWYSFQKNGWSPQQPQFNQTDKDVWFENGKVAMDFGGSWLAGDFAKNPYTKSHADVAVLPKGAQRATVIHGVGYAISAHTSHTNEAWRLVKFLGSKQAALILARNGVIPAYKGSQNAWVGANPEFHLRNFLAELKYSKPFPISEKAADWLNLEDQYFPRAWEGQMSVAAAAKTVAKQMNSILASEH